MLLAREMVASRRKTSQSCRARGKLHRDGVNKQEGHASGDVNGCRGSLLPAVNFYRSCVGLGWLALETMGFILVWAYEE
jgi:hypothetical protein